MLTARERGSPTIVAEKIATQVWANVEEEWMKKRNGILLDLEGEKYIKNAASCEQTTSRSCHTRKKIWNTCNEFSLKKQADGTWNPNQQVCGGQT